MPPPTRCTRKTPGDKDGRTAQLNVRLFWRGAADVMVRSSSAFVKVGRAAEGVAEVVCAMMTEPMGLVRPLARLWR